MLGFPVWSITVDQRMKQDGGNIRRDHGRLIGAYGRV
jgi:hypothetical protein